MPLFCLRARCPSCRTERDLWGPFRADTPAELDALERRVDAEGSRVAHCPTCERVEQVAFFADGQQTEAWLDANEYERRYGRGHPLPPKPWERH